MPRQPIWRDIHAALRAEISEGRYRTGDRLPTEKELSQRFLVNRHTVRRALAELTSEGVIAVRRGSGAYVSEGVIEYRLGARVRFGQNVRDLGRNPSHRFMSADAGPADDRVARHLRLRPGAGVVRIEAASHVDGLPVLVGEHFFSLDRFPGLADACREVGSFTAALGRYGVTDYRRVWTRVTARPPTRRIAEILGQPDSHPVLRTEGLNVDMAGQPVEYAVGWWSGARTQFLVEDA
jgi:GntR family phosphonate transport system transcriptional regulator